MLALLAVALAAAAVIVGSQLIRPSLPALIPAERGTFTSTGSMAYEREQPTLTLLRDGRVLVIGGWHPVAPVEIWDPATGAFTPAGTLSHPRWGHTATLLDDGRVLVVGGAELTDDPSGTSHLTVAEIWDPTTMSFSTLSSAALARFKGTAELQPDGRVLISGGSDVDGTDPVPSEYWDPGSGHSCQPERSPSPVAHRGPSSTTGACSCSTRIGRACWDPTTRILARRGDAQPGPPGRRHRDVAARRAGPGGRRRPAEFGRTVLDRGALDTRPPCRSASPAP